MRQIFTRWIGRKLPSGHFDVVCYEGRLKDKPKRWKVIGYCHSMSQQTAKNTLISLFK